MSGGKILDQIKINLRNTETNDILPVYIDVFDNSLAEKWLSSLNYLLEHNFHLEKNYCFLGFHKSQRSLEYLCKQINFSIFNINASSINYTINDYFTPENCVMFGEMGIGSPGMKVNHQKLNQLHRYFEDLQGTSKNISEYYHNATPAVRWHIRQLNLLCHELESLVLSMRKSIQAPDWRRPSQLMCWLNAPRFDLEESDYEFFGLDKMSKPFGGVTIGVNKAVGKNHWEVFNDEGSDSRIGELTTTTLDSQTKAAGDFDIEWGRTVAGMSFFKKEIEQFTKWLEANGFDPYDKSLTLGYPQVAQVDVQQTFGTDNVDQIWNTLSAFQDVFCVSTSKTSAEYDYHWSDSDFMERQIDIIGN